MRRAPRLHGHRMMSGRIIPADAGSTPLSLEPVRCRRDHPRGCGEHGNWLEPQLRREGSSPRMRGAPIMTRSCTATLRIILADAGSTVLCRPPAGFRRDHPRGCGEHSERLEDHLNEPGSSPRMRGARLRMPLPVFVPVIIPADAGSTHRLPGWSACQGDHPRGCGEHATAQVRVSPEWGSSPRMRGAPVPAVLTDPAVRIIPADAGSTARRP